MNAPLCWIGGKSRLRKTIIERIPEHVCYVECFGGAGWVLFGKERSKVEVYNDLDGELVNFFHVVRNCHKAFIQALDWILVSRKLFTDFIRTKPEDLDEIQRAVRFYYIVKVSFGGKWEGASFGYARTKSSNFNIDAVYDTVTGVHNRLSKVYIEQEDFAKLVERYDGKGTFFYLDPPYHNTFCYRHNFKDEDYTRLEAVLGNINGRFMLSLNDDEFIRKLFKRYMIEEVSVNYTISFKHGKVGELLIKNY